MSKDAKHYEPSIEKLLDIPFKDFMPGQIIQSSQFNDDMLDIEDKVNEIVDKHNLNVNKLHEHLDDKENPHEVNPHQIGTYEDSEIDAFINDVKNGNLNDEAITNRVLADACVDNRVLIDGAVTLSKLDTNIGNQIDISNNMSIKERYTKFETDAIIQEKVGDGTYSKEQIDAKFEEYQAGTIVDGTIDVVKLKDSVGRKLDIEHNPSISNRYTKSEVNTLIAKNGLPKDWGNLSDEVDDEIVTQNGLGSLPISDVMVCGEFKATETDVLNIKVQDVEFAKGEFNTLEERLDNVDVQLAHKASDCLVGEYINVVKYSQINNITLDEAIIELEGEKIFFPNGIHEINNLDSVNNLKGESENNTIIKIVSGRDIQASGFAVYENIKIDLNGEGSLLAPVGDASATKLLKLYKVHICNAINGVVTQLGTHIIDCEIYNCSNYGIYNKGTDCLISNTTIHNTDKAGLYNSGKSLRMSNSKLYLTNRVDYQSGFAIENAGSTSYYSNIEIQQSRGGSLKLGGYGCMFQGATDGCSWFYPNVATDVVVDGEYHVVDLIQKNGSDFSGNHKTSWKNGIKINCTNSKINTMLYNENRQDISNGVVLTNDKLLYNDITVNNQQMKVENNIYNLNVPSSLTRISPYQFKLNLKSNTPANFKFNYDIKSKNAWIGCWSFKSLYQTDKNFKIGITISDGNISVSNLVDVIQDWGKYKSLGFSINRYRLIDEFEKNGGNKDLANCYLTFLSDVDNVVDIFCQNGNIF